MKVLQMNIYQSQCMNGNWNYSLLFKSEEAALKILNADFSGYTETTETTEELKKEQPWRDDIPRTFLHSKKQYDSDGEYDYPIESEITFSWVEVIE